MMRSDCIRICELAIRCNEGSVTEDQVRELERLLTGNDEAVDFYVEFLMSVNLFNQRFQTQISGIQTLKSLTDMCSCGTEALPSFNPELWQAMAEHEQAAPPIAVQSCRVQEAPAVSEFQIRPAASHRINKVSLLTAAVSMAAMLILIAFVHFSPRLHQEPVTVRDVHNAKWNSPVDAEKNSLIPVGAKPIYLSQGVVRLTTGEDVEIIVEAPAEFRFPDSSRLDLRFGRVYVKVPQQGLGFAVMTPSSRIVDLGTEFGVEVSSDGTSSVQVYKGQTLLASLVKDGVQDKNILAKGDSEAVDGTSGHMRKTVFNASAFVRHMDSSNGIVWRGKEIDLADIVGGGNGLGTGTRGTCIDTSSGQWMPTSYLPARAPARAEASLCTDNRYHPVETNPFVDGVFIPGRSETPVTISSLGHVFAECPPTSGYGWGGVLHLEDTLLNRVNAINRERFGVPGQSALFMHSNAGITFDLQQLRSAYAGSFKQFTAVYGIHDEYAAYMNEVIGCPAYADFWVLVDGEVRFCKKGVQVQQGGTIAVDLSDADRFLTLITTDGGPGSPEYEKRNSFHDWCIFGRPVLAAE